MLTSTDLEQIAYAFEEEGEDFWAPCRRFSLLLLLPHAGLDALSFMGLAKVGNHCQLIQKEQTKFFFCGPIHKFLVS
jgi:hypothetical protein